MSVSLFRSALPIVFAIGLGVGCTSSSVNQANGANRNGAAVIPPQPAQPVAASNANGPDASSAVASAPLPQVEGAAAPPIRPLDPNMKVDGAGLLLGDDAAHAWILIENGTAVVDKATGCVTESYPSSRVLADLKSSPTEMTPEQVLEQGDVLAAIRDHVGLGRRFGAQGDRFTFDMVWSLDGRHIALELWNQVFRSIDGGQSFTRVDAGSRLAMAPDGRHLVYERCLPSQGRACRYVALSVDAHAAPIDLTAGQTFLLQFNHSDSQAIFWRSEASTICLDNFELDHGKKTSFCTPFPVAKVVGVWPGREWLSVSPSGKYGIVKWEEARPNLAHVPALTYVVSLIDLKTGNTIKTVTDIRGEVDDNGNMVVDTVNEGIGDHTYYYPMEGSKKLLGDHSFMSWKNGVAMLGVWRKGTLGQRKCDLVKLVKTP